MEDVSELAEVVDEKGPVRVEKRVKRPGSLVRFLRIGKGRYVLKESEKPVAGEVKEQKKIVRKLKNVPSVTAPEYLYVSEDDNQVFYEFNKGMTFEEFYGSKTKLFRTDKQAVKLHIDRLARALAAIHQPIDSGPDKKTLSKLPKAYREFVSREEIVELHGDVNTENVLCDPEKDVLLDPSGKKIFGSRYYDIACFAHHMCFKVPLKFFRFSAFRYGKSYEKYFLSRYSNYSGKKTNYITYTIYRYLHMVILIQLTKRDQLRAKKKRQLIAFLRGYPVRMIANFYLRAYKRRINRSLGT